MLGEKKRTAEKRDGVSASYKGGNAGFRVQE
jgi:hypothetical protein